MSQVSPTQHPGRTERIYLDYAATAPLRPQSKAAMLEAWDILGNPSSVHGEGRAARAVLEIAREKVAALAGARPKQVVFTSGATEANAWALSGPWGSRLVSATEHASVLEPARKLGADIAPVDANGLVDLTWLDDWLANAGERPFVSVQMVNNETGVVQPIGEIARRVKAAGGIMHSDVTQAAGKEALAFAVQGLDLMSLSAHKIGGPMGVGALVQREDAGLPSLFIGGGQEISRRAGTQNVPAIAGFGAAAEAASSDLAGMATFELWRGQFESALAARLGGLKVFGADAPRAATISNFALPGEQAESLVIRLDLAGAAVSAGSACSSGKVSASHVIAAMGAGADLAKSALRVSFGWASREDDLIRFADLLTGLVATTSSPAGAPALVAKA